MDNGREETARRIVMQHVLGTSYAEVMLHVQDELTAEQRNEIYSNHKGACRWSPCTILCRDGGVLWSFFCRR